MADKVEVPVPLDPKIAAALADPATRAAAGRLLSRLLKPTDRFEGLAHAMDLFAAEAVANGLTPDILDQELAAHKRERRA